jgi:NADH:ubiquinone oxidoreductase subunit D
MRRISARAVCTGICRIKCLSIKVSKIRNAKAMAKLNENRQGSLLDFIEDFTRRFPGLVDEYETLLTDNRIWKQRTVALVLCHQNAP